MRAKTAKLLKKFATTLPEWNLPDKVIEHKRVSNNKKPSIITRLQVIKGSNHIICDLKRTWNSLSWQDKSKLVIEMNSAVSSQKKG